MVNPRDVAGNTEEEDYIKCRCYVVLSESCTDV